MFDSAADVLFEQYPWLRWIYFWLMSLMVIITIIGDLIEDWESERNLAVSQRELDEASTE